MQWLQRLFLLGLLCASAPGSADQDSWYTDMPPEPWGGEGQSQEQPVAVPPFPTADDLVDLGFDFAGYRYHIDRRSLAVAIEDGVVRYTVVIDSPEGTRNVLFEGIRCRPREYKTYAYATGDGPFHESSSAEWIPIRSGSAFGYRRDLQEIYLCRGLLPRRSTGEMLHRIQYPPSVNDARFRD